MGIPKPSARYGNALTSHARLILTDSGGLQEESTALGIPCLTLRENTERPVTVTHGTNQVVGTATQAILAGFAAALSPNGAIGDPARASAEHGRRYWQAATQHALEQIAAAERGGDDAGAAPPA